MLTSENIPVFTIHSVNFCTLKVHMSAYKSTCVLYVFYIFLEEDITHVIRCYWSILSKLRIFMHLPVIPRYKNAQNTLEIQHFSK